MEKFVIDQSLYAVKMFSIVSMLICKIVNNFRDSGIPNGKDEEIVGIWHRREAYNEVFIGREKGSVLRWLLWRVWDVEGWELMLGERGLKIEEEEEEGEEEEGRERDMVSIPNP